MELVIERALKVLNAMHRGPQMFASCKEALLCEISAMLYLVLGDEKFNTIEWFKKHLNTRGCAWVGLSDPVEDEWARKVICDAIEQITNAR